MSRSKGTITIRRRASSHTIHYDFPADYVAVHDLSPYFTVTRDRQGLSATKAGEFQTAFVNPINDWLFS